MQEAREMDNPGDLVRRHGAMVWQVVLRIAGGREADASDCFQEVFVAALELARRNTVSVRNWEAMLRRIATSKGLDLLRRRMRERARFARDVLWDELPGSQRIGAPGDGIERQELVQDLRAALAQLPPEQAEVFCLRHIDEMSYDEIGSLVGSTANAVGVTLHRARQRLRELMSPCEAHSGVSHE